MNPPPLKKLQLMGRRCIAEPMDIDTADGDVEPMEVDPHPDEEQPMEVDPPPSGQTGHHTIKCRLPVKRR
ncbi:hypothetical protein Anapl_18080, partial [Anas platyrhynchos]